MDATATTINLRRKGRAAAWWKVMRQRSSAFFGLVVIAVFVFAAVFAPLVAPYDPTDKSGMPFEAPSLRPPPRYERRGGRRAERTHLRQPGLDTGGGGGGGLYHHRRAAHRDPGWLLPGAVWTKCSCASPM